MRKSKLIGGGEDSPVRLYDNFISDFRYVLKFVDKEGPRIVYFLSRETAKAGLNEVIAKGAQNISSDFFCGYPGTELSCEEKKRRQAERGAAALAAEELENREPDRGHGLFPVSTIKKIAISRQLKSKIFNIPGDRGWGDDDRDLCLLVANEMVARGFSEDRAAELVESLFWCGANLYGA